MPGETVLVIEDSSSERDYAQGSLEDVGYRVITAGNAAAALTFPEVKEVSVIVMDAQLMGVSGFEATRMLRQQASTHPIPILLLIPDDSLEANEDISPRGANGYLIKPYDAKILAKKVGRLIEQQHLDDLASQYLEHAADVMMESLADKHVKSAVERKTQIIIERCIQNVATAVDQRARAQVNESVTALTAEKEQELVKFTVREVAQSMVEKLAERKVTEAMETVLAEQAERTVKRIADQILPGALREKLKDSLNNTLPREIQTRVQRTMEKEGPEIAKQLIATVEDATGKVVPRIAREIMPEIIDRRFRELAATQVPQLVREQVGQEIQNQMMQRIEPMMRDVSSKLRKALFFWVGGMSVVILGVVGFLLYMLFFVESPPTP